MTRLFASNSLQNFALLVILAIQSQALAESDFQYFNSHIDFWHDRSSKADPPNKTGKENPQLPSGPAEASSNEGSFPWKKYTDPKNKEFFKEGDYTPPEPFMEIVRNPTDANIKMWFAYIDKKNELSHKLQERMQEYMVKNGLQGQPGADLIKPKLAALPVAEPNTKRFRFRMYFDSHCPHCKKMFGTLSELQARGFYVEAKQVDSDSRGIEGINIPTSKATPNELQGKDIQSVPVLFIGDLEKKKVYRLSGYQTTANIFAAIAQGNSQP